MIDRLETPRLVLRKARRDDLDAIWRNVWSDDDLAASMLWRPIHSREEAEARLARTMELQAGRPLYFVCLKGADEPIGFAGVHSQDGRVYEESGICVAARWQGKGLGGEILRALLELAFDTLGGERFLYSCFRDNRRSARLCQSLGFRFASGREDVRAWDGMRYVSHTYALTREEWEKGKKGQVDGSADGDSGGRE